MLIFNPRSLCLQACVLVQGLSTDMVNAVKEEDTDNCLTAAVSFGGPVPEFNLSGVSTCDFRLKGEAQMVDV